MAFESERKRDEKMRKRNMVLGIFIALILVLSTVGYAIIQGASNKEENINEEIEQGKFKTTVNNYPIDTFYSPDEINKCENCGSYQSYINQVVYYVVETEDEIKAAAEIDYNFHYLIQRSQIACNSESDLEYCEANKLPTKDCSDNLIIIKEADENKIEKIDNCVYIFGQKKDLIKQADEFILNIFGVK